MPLTKGEREGTFGHVEFEEPMMCQGGRVWNADMYESGSLEEVLADDTISFFLDFLKFIFLYSRFLLVIHFIHISVYMSIPISQFITPPPPTPAAFPPWYPYVCSLHLCLYFCPAGQFICTIFLGSTYMC